jgi:hypothetical protein
MPKTYEPISTQTLGTAVSSVTFSSIPQTYTDLVLVVQVLSNSTNDDMFMQFDSDTGANYGHTVLRGQGTSASSSYGTSTTGARFSDQGSPKTTSSMISIVNLQNYSNGTTYKTIISRSNNGSIGLDLFTSLWLSTSSIDSIKVYPASGNMAVGSTFTLYGIKAA